MPTFAYTGRGARGVINGEIDAPDRTTAVGELRSRAILVSKITEKAGGKTPVKIGGKVSDKEMAIFTRQFSTMVDAGLPLVQCLNILAEQSESKTLRGVTASVARQVEAGSTLADALRRHPRTFDDLFTNLVQVGETGGILDIVLQRLSQYIEKAAALKRKVKAAMIYPATIIGVAFLVVIFMLTFVIPTFASMFKGLGAELPLPTQIVLWLSDFVRGYILLIIAAIGGIRAASLLQDGGRSGDHRRAGPQGAGVRHPDPEGVGGALHPDLRHPRFLGRTHPGRPAHHRAHRRQPGRGEGGHAVPGRGHCGQNAVGAAQGLRCVPAHGDPDDLGRRADGRPGRDALEDRRLLR